MNPTSHPGAHRPLEPVPHPSRGLSSPCGRAPRRLAAARLLPLLLLPLLGAACEDAGPTGAEWELVWADEFEGPAGQPPDPSRWTYDIGTDWGNGQLEWTTDRPENVSLDGSGNLAIVARQEAFQGQPYTSARIKTQGLFEQQYGRFEARIRLPTGRGIWPAFWMLGNDLDVVGWPQSGEIDVMEFRGQEPNVLFGALHGPGHSGANAYSRRYQLPQGRLDTGFRVYAVEWREDVITWMLDDVTYHIARRGEVPGDWVYDHPFFLILNIAVGGGFVGPPDESTVFPQTMLVDYVRVYGAPR